MISIWNISIDGCPVSPIKVKILCLYPLKKYLGKTNYSIQNPEQAGPYRSLRSVNTPQEALEDAINGFLMYYKPELKEQTKFILDPNF